MHADARNEEVLAARHEHEAEALGPHRDPPGHQVGELDRRVLLAPDAGDLPAALEGVEPFPQRVRLGLGNVEAAADLGEGEDSRPLLPEAIENLGVAGQHAAESTRTAAGERRREAVYGLVSGSLGSGSFGVKSPGQSSRFSGSGGETLRDQPHDRHRITPSTGLDDGL